MNQPLVSIIMRSYNEAWALSETFQALRRQAYTHWELIVIDSGSTDGSQRLIEEAKPAHFLQIQPHDYNPSRVMNRGMALARSEWCVFLDADATPQGTRWLDALVRELWQPGVAAVFGRQIPRPDCRAVFACDYERCFGPERESAMWEHFFSMVSSALRKEVWRQRGFREDLQYAEDREYTRWCKAAGYEVRYVPNSVVMHSHNYTPEQAWRQSFGDARAIGQAWNGRHDAFNWPRTVLIGWLCDLRHDVKFCTQKGRLLDLPHAMHIRWKQRNARLDGFQEGLRLRSQRTPSGSELRAAA